ncbi:MAG: methyltransferase domain-containing protein [Desulfocapsaceae bacterium]|nr:methyltransferase domain-containing protein [Desulfocapsaceae bacterium]
MSLIEDIEEFMMSMPYGDIVKQVTAEPGLTKYNYIKKAESDMFPFGIKDINKWEFYKSDKYSAYLFWKVVQEIEENKPVVPQMLANIVVGHCTQPRILIYGCGTGLIALGLRGMEPQNEDITIADIPGRYFEFLQYLSNKYGLGFKFIPVLNSNEDPISKKYDVILFNGILSDIDRKAVIIRLASHVEDMQTLYLNTLEAPTKNCRISHFIKQLNEIDMEATGHEGDFWRVWRKKPVVQQQKEEISKTEPIKETHIFPTSIACLSTLPGTPCGIATYTKMLTDSLSKRYPTNIFRDINKGVPKNALILASIEFGIFQDVNMLINAVYETNWKFAIWHTVMRDPFQGYTKYLKNVDTAYDVHIVHTIAQKAWLSKFVEKPIYVVPHGTLLWDPIPTPLAKQKLGIQADMRMAFCFGFAADSKGLDELIDISKKLKLTLPDFKIVMSAGINNATKEATEFTVNLQNNLKKVAESSGTIVLGKYLSDEEINLWASASDILLFNYKTPPYIASGSGAMKRVLAAGKPIICVDDNRLEELVEGEHCLKFRPGDRNSLIQCIQTLLIDKKRAEMLGENCHKLAAKTSWEHTAEKILDIIGSTIMGYGPNYYDESYFIGRSGGKYYINPNGERKEWSYYNPDGEWLGADYIMKGIKQLLNPRTMLSVGEGRGTFCAYARDHGIIASGIDFSQWAIDHPYPKAKGLIELGDVRDLKFEDRSMELIFCSDIMEHIYIEDMQGAISEIERVADKWIFYNIGSSMGEDENGDLIVAKNQLPPKDRLVTAVAGHVTVKPEVWWREKLGGHGWKFRDDLVAEFRKIVPADVLTNWKCILIAERCEV